MVQGVIANLGNVGVFDVIVPFILIFTIVYAVLHKTKILGERAKNFNMIIGLVMGLSVVVPHALWGTADPTDPYLVTGMIDIVKVINNSLPSVSVLLVAVLMILLIFGVWGSKIRLGSNSLSGIIAAFAFLSVIYIFGSAADWWNFPPFLYVLENPETQAMIVTILVFAIIIWFITKEDDRNEEREDAFGKFFGSLFDNDERR